MEHLSTDLVGLTLQNSLMFLPKSSQSASVENDRFIDFWGER